MLFILLGIFSTCKNQQRFLLGVCGGTAEGPQITVWLSGNEICIMHQTKRQKVHDKYYSIEEHSLSLLKIWTIIVRQN